jgi:putative peptide zinc metalloprotease protein
MTAFFVSSWFRVAGLRPFLQEHVKSERHRYGRQSWYALHDRLTGRVHRVTPAAFLFAVRMDGKRTVDEIWQELVTELDADAPGQELVLRLLSQLHHADLLAGDLPPDATELLKRRDQQARSTLLRNLRSPLSLQIPLFDPDWLLRRALPFVRPLLSPLGCLLWLGLVVAGAVTAAQHWAELTENVADRVMLTQGLIAFALCYPVIKVLHEFGHGIVAKRFGCEVREVGVMLLVLFPVPYVDATNSAALRSRWQRAAVAAAGIAVELGLAAGACLFWAAAEPGIARAVAFDVMLIGGASTLLVNGNPLLRFDGYYVLSDVLGVPNLASRGMRYLGYLVNRYVFGVAGLPHFHASAWERGVMLVYVPVSWCYRMSMLAAVALFVASHFFLVGVGMAALTVLLGIGLPLAKGLSHVASSPFYAGRRLRSVGLTYGAVAGVGLALLFLRVPVHTTAQGVVWLPESSLVRAGTDGFITEVEAAPGETVQRGAMLFTLRHDIFEARMKVRAARVDELQAKLKADFVTDRIAAGVDSFELGQEQAALAREQERLLRMVVIAGQDGVFTPSRPVDDAPGRYVKEGDVLGWVTPPGGAVARVLVPQEDMGLMQGRLQDVRLLLPDGETALPTHVLRAVPGATSDLPNPAFASSNGGSIPVDVRETKVLRAFERYFQFDLALPPETVDGSAPFGARVHARFDYGWEPVGEVLYRRVRQMLLSRFET